MRSMFVQKLVLLAIGAVQALASETKWENVQQAHAFRRSINDGVELRILPLGASITAGVDSSTGNGYRLDLERLLEDHGNNVTYVGTRSRGQMEDNACEAYPGYTIAQIDKAMMASGALDFRPNVVLLNAGTNDCAEKNKDPAGAPNRYATLLRHIKEQCPDALVVASSLLPNLRPAVNRCIKTLNPALRRVTQEAAANGQKAVFVDMYDAVPTKDINRKDKTHPGDAGYQKMARVWYQGIRNASRMIDAPTENSRRPLDSPKPVSNAILITPSMLILLGCVGVVLATLS